MLDLPSLDLLRPKFIDQEEIEMTLTSDIKKLKYTLLIKWVTEEYELAVANE